jgi:hypothetical protein
VGHAVVGSEGDIVASLDKLAVRKTLRVALDDLFRQSLGRSGRGRLLGQELRRDVFELRYECRGDICASGGAGGRDIPRAMMEERGDNRSCGD